MVPSTPCSPSRWFLVFTVTRVIFIPQGEFVAFGALTLASLQAGHVPGTVWLLLGLGTTVAILDGYHLVREGRYARLPTLLITNVGIPLLFAAGLFAMPPTQLPLWTQVVIAMLLVVPLGPMIYRIAFQPLASAPVLVLLIVAVAVHLALIGLGLLFFGAEGWRTPAFTDLSFELAGAPLQGQTILVVVASALLIIGLYFFFERTIYGKALRATAMNRTGARLMGIPPVLAGKLCFTLAAAIGAFSGILIAPITTIYYDSGFLIGLKGFVGAIIGGLASYPLAALGAILVGLLESYSSFYASAFKEVIVFTLIIPVLLWRSLTSHHIEEEEEKSEETPGGTVTAGKRGSRLIRHLPMLAFIAVLGISPLLLPEFTITLLNYIGLYAIVAVGLVLLTGVGGLTSFGQAAFVGLGAYTTAWLTTVYGLSPWVTLFIGMAITGAVALSLGFITLRMGGHYLPLGTIAWGISLYFLFGNVDFLGGHTGITGIPTVSLFGWELKSGREFFYLIWLFVLLAIVSIRNLLDSRVGRAIRALKGGYRDGRGDGRQYGPREDHHLPDRCPAGQHFRLAVRPPATLRQSDTIRADPGDRIPVHGRRRWRWSCLGCRARRRRDHHPEAVAAGLAAAIARPERQFRDHRLRHRHGARAAKGEGRPVAGAHAPAAFPRRGS